MKKLLTVLVLLSATLYAAEEGSPAWIVESFFEAKTFPVKEVYYTGEMLHYIDKANMGSRIPPEVQTDYRILKQDDQEVVFAVTYSYEGEAQNWYSFIKKVDETWKLEAVRKLALPGLFYKLLDRISKKQDRSVDEEWDYQNMLLQIKSDRELKEFLKDHLETFREVLVFFDDDSLLQVKGPDDVRTKNETAFTQQKEVGLLVRTLHLNYVGRRRSDMKTIEFNVGGIMDNSVGFMFVPDGYRPPKMSSEEFIYVEEVLPNWFIYKTT